MFRLALVIMLTCVFVAHADASATYLVAISDALGKRHLGIYGYPRRTTPNLQQERELIVFRHAYARAATADLSQALHARNQYLQVKDAHSLLTALNAAGVKTFWLTNRDQPRVAHNGENTVVRKGSLSAVIRPELAKILSNQARVGKNPQAAGDVVVFVDLVHQQTSVDQHFKGELPRNVYGHYQRIAPTTLNAYDNRMLAVDKDVARLLQVVKQHGGVSGFIWFATRGFNLLAASEKGFAYSQVNIPLVMWFSPAYRQRQAARYRTLRSRVGALFSSDLLHDTLLGIFSVPSAHYRSSFDLSHAAYSVTADRALVRNGKQKYVTPANRRWWQQHNVRSLQAEGEDQRIIPHWVNSIGKLREMWHDGYRAFELDLFYDEKRNCFVVGHDAENMSTMCFDTFLAQIQISELKKLWLDIKNLTSKNIAAQLLRLNQLSDKLALKQKVIFESSIESRDYRQVARAGYHTSYYLPTIELLALQTENDSAKLSRRAQQLAAQAKSQEVQAVSFDVRLYPFVKIHLEQLLPQHYVYHVWSLPGTMEDELFFQNTRSKMYYYDPRVKTILSEYNSIFHL